MTRYSKEVYQPLVKLNGTYATPFEVETVTRSLGGSRNDAAVIYADQSALDRPAGDWWHDRHASGGFIGQRLDIFDYSGEGMLFTGWVRKVLSGLTPDGPMLRLVATIEPHHYGLQLRGPRIRSVTPAPGSTTSSGTPGKIVTYRDLDEPVIFNPMIDGQVRGNKSGYTEAELPLFVDPDQVATLGAVTWTDESITKLTWTLAEAVWYLCWRLNPLEEFVRNPADFLDLDLLLATHNPDKQTPVLSHQDLPLHHHLPRLLDHLLTPYGYTWKLEPEFGQLPQIQIVPLGISEREAFVDYQRHGEMIDPELTRTPVIDVHYDAAGQLSNYVHLIGDVGYVESTWELTRAWPETLSSAALENLEGETSETYRRVWREWVLNEAGDYCNGTHLGPGGILTRTPYDFSRFDSGEFIGRRKRFLPCITTNDDGAPAGETRPGIRVEYSLDGGGTWYPAEDLGQPIEVLDREAGIRFHGTSPPELLMAAGTSARVRVTATLATDKRIQKLDVGLTSPNPHTSPVLLDLADRFHYRRVDDLSTYATDVISGARRADTVDDSERLADLAAELLKAWNVAAIDGGLIFHGTDLPVGVELGNVLHRIGRREISLATDAEQTRGAQIVAMRWQWNEQTQNVRVTLGSSPGFVEGIL